MGIIYLENSQIPHAFTDERTHMLLMISAQLAISFENAGKSNN
jgi:GAF domain-containing protein